MIIKEFKCDGLAVKICDNRKNMGQYAGELVVSLAKRIILEKGEVNIIFAAAPSQNDILDAMVNSTLDFSKVNALHMDEYIGLDKDAPQLFANYLNEHIFSLKKFKSINLINGNNDVKSECENYTKLLQQYLVDITLMGIGENGHIAFNDPPVADFNDKAKIKQVTLDNKCKAQQVNDGCFKNFELVPNTALTLTIPALLAARYVICTVPGERKCDALTTAICGYIGEYCPATVLRNYDNCTLFADQDSGKNLMKMDNNNWRTI